MIYIEDYIIQNYIINLTLFRLVHLTNKCKTSEVKMLIFAMLFTLANAYLLLFEIPKICSIALQLIITLLTLNLIFKSKPKQALLNLIFFSLFQYAFYGLITYFACSNFITNSGIIACYKFDINKILVSLLIFEYFAEKIAKSLVFKLKTNNFICKIKLTNGQNSLALNAFIDSGNMLNKNGKSVVILSVDSYITLTHKSPLDIYLKSSTLQTKTIVGKENLPIVEIEKIEIFYNKKRVEILNPLIALSRHNFKNTNYQALVSPTLL